MSKNNKDGHFNAEDIAIAYAKTGNTTQTVAGVGAAVKADSTTTGGTGATAYTVADIVAALKAVGILAA